MINRRALLRTAGLGLLMSTGLISATNRVSHATPARSRYGPRYVVQIFLRGGIDPLYSFEPKTAEQVDRRVYLPYSARDIVEGPVPLAPYLAPIKKWSDRLAIIHGVRVNTANHFSGVIYAYQLRTTTFHPESAESFIRLVGSQTGGAPRGSVAFNDGVGPPAPGDEIISLPERKPLFDRLEEMGPELREEVRTALVHQRDSLRSAADPRRNELSRSVSEALDLMEAVSRAPRFKARPFSDAEQHFVAARDIQRTAWLFQNDIVRAARVRLADWDSHHSNDQKQRTFTTSLGHWLRQTFELFASTRNESGTLLDNTLFIIHSELSRTPILNAQDGKDHLPEAPIVLLGPGIRPGVYNRTGALMQGGRVSFASGRPDESGDYITLDDVGATLGTLCGLNPALTGFSGRRLSFALA